MITDISILRGLRTATTDDTSNDGEQPTACYQLQRVADQNQKIVQQSTEVYKQYQENVKKVEFDKTRILKGLMDGEENLPLLDICTMSLQCIGKLTNDTVFIQQTEKRLDIKSESFINLVGNQADTLEQIKNQILKLETEENTKEISSILESFECLEKKLSSVFDW